jgi:anaerobic ribonucleoside-triphosphate reductase activating protein
MVDLRVHHFEAISHANGPGVRCVLWLQGCTLGCPGCFNQETHSTYAGRKLTVGQALQEIKASSVNVQGLTVSGGEPFQQLVPLLSLLTKVRDETDLSVLVFTGFSEAEFTRFPQWHELANCIDVVIAGRYEQSQRLADGLIGSQNKTVRFCSNRYSLRDLESVPPAEIVVGTNGEIILSGIDPVDWKFK